MLHNRDHTNETTRPNDDNGVLNVSQKWRRGATECLAIATIVVRVCNWRANTSSNAQQPLIAAQQTEVGSKVPDHKISSLRQ